MVRPILLRCFLWLLAPACGLLVSPAVGAAPVVAAQAAATLEGSGARVAYTDGATISSLSLSPGFQLLRPWQSLAASGTYARYPDAAWSVQAQVVGSTFTPALLGVRAEVGGTASGTWHEDESHSSELLGSIRLHALGRQAGAWIGGHAGRAWDGSSWHTLAFGELAGWANLGRGTLTVALSPTRIGDSLRHIDTESALRWNAGRVELVGYGGLRRWIRPAGASGAAWGGASITYWLDDHVALVGSGGAYPADYAQGLPRGSYGAVGVRVATRRVLPNRIETGGTGTVALPPARQPDPPALEARRDGDDGVTLLLAAPRASMVEVMGDFTEWQPVALTRSSGERWSVTLRIPAGIHRMNVRIDDGEWAVPAGVTAIADEFGGKVGMLVIE
jgi:hypothetical protein